MEAFVRVAEASSFAEAARQLGVTSSVVTNRIQQLEKFVNAPLFHRSTRQLQLTDEGRLYLSHCEIALRAVEDAEAALHAGQNAVRGKLRISASADFGRHLLSQWLDEFSVAHPQLKIALTLSDSLSNLLQDDIDLAIRFGRPQDGALVA
ncbi:LysR family transcriptional regulator, partial [Paraburkholderia sp. SIMBA_009]